MLYLLLACAKSERRSTWNFIGIRFNFNFENENVNCTQNEIVSAAFDFRLLTIRRRGQDSIDFAHDHHCVVYSDRTKWKMENDRGQPFIKRTLDNYN